MYDTFYILLIFTVHLTFFASSHLCHYGNFNLNNGYSALA
jgi:hypothetical protein